MKKIRAQKVGNLVCMTTKNLLFKEEKISFSADGGEHATSPDTALDSSALRCFFLYSELKINAPNNTILSLSAFILAAVLVRELKKVDDKELIIDVQRPA